MIDDFENDLRIAVMRLSRRIRLERPGDEVTDSQLAVLFTLIKQGPQTLGALSDSERVTPPSMNRTVNCLETEGLITREAAADDGRKVLISPTPAARTLVAEARRRRAAWFSQQVEALTEEQRVILTAAAPILGELAVS